MQYLYPKPRISLSWSRLFPINGRFSPTCSTEQISQPSLKCGRYVGIPLNFSLSIAPVLISEIDKEVQGYYEDGMRVPDDVTLLWSDDK